MSTAEAVMTTQDIANRLYTLSKESKWTEALNELYAENAVSVEPPTSQGLQTVEGLDNIKKKGEEFTSMIEEVHGGYVGEPIVAGNFIALTMGMDVTMKNVGRIKIDEIAVYEVKDGKIVKEEFFY
jgi:ketosteroid isomerase-like protein